MPLNTRLSSTRGFPRDFGKNGRSRAICSSVSQKCPLIMPPLFGSLNHAAQAASSRFMGPEPRQFCCLSALIEWRKSRHVVAKMGIWPSQSERLFVTDEEPLFRQSKMRNLPERNLRYFNNRALIEALAPR